MLRARAQPGGGLLVQRVHFTPHEGPVLRAKREFGFDSLASQQDLLRYASPCPSPRAEYCRAFAQHDDQGPRSMCVLRQQQILHGLQNCLRSGIDSAWVNPHHLSLDVSEGASSNVCSAGSTSRTFCSFRTDWIAFIVRFEDRPYRLARRVCTSLPLPLTSRALKFQNMLHPRAGHRFFLCGCNSSSLRIASSSSPFST